MNRYYVDHTRYTHLKTLVLNVKQIRTTSVYLCNLFLDSIVTLSSFFHQRHDHNDQRSNFFP